MKKHAIIILNLFFVSIIPLQASADICPLVSQFQAPTTPPAGWTILIPAVFPGDSYRFSSATHSLNPTYYPLQILCKYECAPDARNCSPFTIISNAPYRQPVKSISPWIVSSQFVNTLVCAPNSHDPLLCVFSNIPNDQVSG